MRVVPNLVMSRVAGFAVTIVLTAGAATLAAEPVTMPAQSTCRWDGTAPICDGECAPGELAFERAASQEQAQGPNFGEDCIGGAKVYCCRLSCPAGWTLEGAPARRTCVPLQDAGVPVGPQTIPIPPLQGRELEKGPIVAPPGPVEGTGVNRGPIIAKPGDAPPPGQASASFEGAWIAVADNVNYNILMSQTGTHVIGNFAGADGSQGQLSGTLADRVLRFTWSQLDGQKGSGKFTLSTDGQSFAGSYNFGTNPDVVQGTWNGKRR